jgi:hypothetical protein
MRIKGFSANRNFYMNTNQGLLRLENFTLGLAKAGFVKPIEPDISAAIAADGIDMLADQSYAYRVVFNYFDSKNNLFVSEPSNIVQIKVGANGAYAFTIKVRFVKGLTNRCFYQVYRTKVSAVGVDAGDQMYLDYQSYITSSDLITGFVTIRDIRRDVILGDELYTDTSQDGIILSNGRPPYCRTMMWYQGHMFCLNTYRQQTRLISVIGTNFIAGRQLNIGGITYTVADTTELDITKVNEGTDPNGENKATGTFVNYHLITDVATQIEGIARSLCRVINGYGLNTQYYAYYDSVPGTSPGRIRIVERDIGGTPYDFNVPVASIDLGLNFEPILTSNTGVVLSSNNDSQNAVIVSKPNQPEHFPPTLTTYYLGDQDNPIVNAFATRDAGLIIKKKGIWIVTGKSLADFVFKELDPTVEIGDRSDSCALLGDTVHAISSQGPVRISSTGVEYEARSEDRNIVYGTYGVPDNYISVGIGHEAKRLYLCSTKDPELFQEQLSDGSITYPYSSFVKSDSTETWSRWFINAGCFTVIDNILYWGMNTPNGTIMRQRPNAVPGTTNYHDEESTVNISAINPNTKTVTLTFTPSVDYGNYFTKFFNLKRYGYDSLGFGWVIMDGQRQYVVLSYDSGAGTAVLNRVTGLTTGDKTVLRPIPYFVTKSLLYGNSPQNTKEVKTINVTGALNNAYQLTFEFYTELDHKKFPHYYSYYNGTVNDPNIQIKTYPMRDPLHPGLSDAQAPERDIRDKNDQRFFERVVRIAVPPKKFSNNQLCVNIINILAGAQFDIKSVGFELDQLETNKTNR